MNSPQPALSSAASHHDWTRRLVNILVALVVIAVAGATFVFSYAGVHAIALLGGVSAQLARYYPGLFDAVLVIASVTALMLRGKRWWARLWAWMVIIIVLGAIGTSDVLHAMNYSLRHRPTEGIVAAAPVVAVLLAFSLLLTLLRQSRAQAPSAPAATPLDVPALPAAVSALPIALPAALAVSSEAAESAAASAAEPRDAQTEPIATLPVSAAPVRIVPPTVPVPVPAGALVPDVTPASPEPVRDETPEAPQDAASEADAGVGGHAALEEDAAPGEHTAPEEVPREAHLPTGPDEVISTAAPTVESPAVPEEPAPPAEPAAPTVEVPAAAVSPVPERSQGIRYAGRGVRHTPPSPDYWESDDTEQFAGLVYRARDDDDEDDVPAAGAATRPNPPELDDDAPPFATAPFAPMPRLNRVRSMPAPPAGDNQAE